MSISYFYDHEVQSLVALFLTKPELYKDHLSERDKQGYFFDRFRAFAKDYYHFDKDLDIAVYFSSLRKESAGEFNACGGAGKMSNSTKKYFKDRCKSVESNRQERIDSFAKKYRVDFEKADPRQFVGVSEIWNRLDSAIEIVASSKWSDIASRAYTDPDLLEPIPKNLDKLLVPLEFRNRVVQKHRNAQRTSFPVRRVPTCADLLNDVDEDDPITISEIPQKLLVIPQECFDEDW